MRERVQHKRGIALLVTVIFMTVMLSFGIALAALSYKQSVLASTAIQSQTAFFAADGALECALYADQQEGDYFYGDWSITNEPDPATMAGYAAAACNGQVMTTPAPVATWDSTRLAVFERISYNQGQTCADLTIYKYGAPLSSGERDFIFSTGYNVPCSSIVPGARVVSRGLYEKY